MGLDTSRKRANEGSVDFYGDADYNSDKGNKTATQVLAEINADPSKMGNGGLMLVDLYMHESKLMLRVKNQLNPVLLDQQVKPM